MDQDVRVIGKTAKGLIEKWLGETDDPLGFLVHEGGASSMIEAAYRYARHEPGVDVTLFATADSVTTARLAGSAPTGEEVAS